VWLKNMPFPRHQLDTLLIILTDLQRKANHVAAGVCRK
jgi:hypothetical protein